MQLYWAIIIGHLTHLPDQGVVSVLDELAGMHDDASHKIKLRALSAGAVGCARTTIRVISSRTCMHCMPRS